MIIPSSFAKSVGMWSGSNRLYLSEEGPGIESVSNACVGSEANENFLKINYDWVYEDKPQEGLMLFNVGKDSTVTSVWIDSFHQSGAFMNCRGTFENNKISVKGNYTQPEYADWAWRTNLEFVNENSFTFTMYNVSPDGKEDVAVVAKFERKQ